MLWAFEELCLRARLLIDLYNFIDYIFWPVVLDPTTREPSALRVLQGRSYATGRWPDAKKTWFTDWRISLYNTVRCVMGLFVIPFQLEPNGNGWPTKI